MDNYLNNHNFNQSQKHNLSKKIPLKFDTQTNIGKVRKNNEDNYLLEIWDNQAVLAIVADGMGGRSGGEVASQIAIETFRELLQEPLPNIAKKRYEKLLEKYYQADNAIKEKVNDNFRLMGMGTTIVTAIITPTELIHLYAGDCRLYHFRENQCLYVTSDHSVVQVLLELGRITEADIATHPMRSIIHSCLGGGKNANLSIDPKWDNPEIPVIRELYPGDILLLSSDGMQGEINNKELQSLVEKYGENPENLTKFCIEAALKNGGSDNITLIAIRVEGE